VAVAVIEREERFLLRQRPPGGHLPGLWEFPGGKVEEDESWEEALARELEEELDVAARPVALVEERVFDYPERRVHLRFYRTVLEPGSEPRAVEAGAPLRWATASELLALPVPDANRHVIERLTAPFSSTTPGESESSRKLTVGLWAAGGLPVALVFAGMTVMAADNVARVFGIDLVALADAGPLHLLGPYRSIGLAAFVLYEAIAVAIGLWRATRC
jgi:8-oxo-dGTP diphosphatase